MNPPLTAELLDELERLHAKATPGPWPEPLSNGMVVVVHSAKEAGRDPSTGLAGERRDIIVRLQYCSLEDQAIIIAAVNALPALIAVGRAQLGDSK